MVKIIENYTLHEQIGQGEYGKVYRGIDSRNKKQVAVKVINVKKFKQYPKLEQCTLNQIEVLSKIQSPHIVKFIQILKTANNFYFFYEFCNQGTLEDVIKSKGPLPQPLALEYFGQILQAFKILANKNIMHRDLKPSNILVSDGIIKIADFGFCKSLQNQRDLAQTMLGSPIYMAPEVLKGQIYTIKADIWSLGVVLYQMLFGFCPFQQRSIARLINLLDKQQVSFNQQINKITPALQQLIKRMLIKDHFRRINWKQIFQYKINGVNLIKSYSYASQQKQQKQKERPASVGYEPHSSNNLLKQVKNFHNIIERQERPPSRTSFDFNYQDSSAGKSNSQNIQPPAPTMFKKSNQNIPKPFQPSLILQQTSYLTNKENLSTAATELSSLTIRSKGMKNKVQYFLKLAAQVISFNYFPQITMQLCLKIYQTIQKQISKSEDYVMTTNEKQALVDAIKSFQEEIQKQRKTNISGPILNYYIKNLQISQKDSFQSTNSNKDLLIHCISLLDLNQFSIREKSNEYCILSKEKLISELYQKIIRNII